MLVILEVGIVHAEHCNVTTSEAGIDHVGYGNVNSEATQ